VAETDAADELEDCWEMVDACPAAELVRDEIADERDDATEEAEDCACDTLEESEDAAG